MALDGMNEMSAPFCIVPAMALGFSRQRAQCSRDDAAGESLGILVPMGGQCDAQPWYIACLRQRAGLRETGGNQVRKFAALSRRAAGYVDQETVDLGPLRRLSH
jgi:hypothetical protein